MQNIQNKNHKVVIVGGGFGGLYAAKSLRKSGIRVTIVDKRNFHLFQPLLYQVATGELSPGDIASPLRTIFSKTDNTNVITGEMVDINPNQNQIILNDGKIKYDTLIIATGVEQNYFGHEDWNYNAPSLKTIEDALDIRGRILYAFEEAEKEIDPEIRKTWLTFVIIGGGATGVELSGALAELAFNTLKNEYRNFGLKDIRIILIEAAGRILSSMPESLSNETEKSLLRFGVIIKKKSLVTTITEQEITIKIDNHAEKISTRNVMWTAGVKGSSISKALVNKTGVQLDNVGRVLVNADLSIPGFENIFVIGDLANYSHQTGQPLPGIAPVAIQEGKFVAMSIIAGQLNKKKRKFIYRNKGMLAVIGRNAALADFGWLKFSGFFAWMLWVFVHILYLIEFDNRFVVMFRWSWNYITNKKGSRLITGKYVYTIRE